MCETVESPPRRIFQTDSRACTRHKILFEPVKMGPVISRNRFYQTPHGTGAAHLPQADAGIGGMRAEGGWGVVSCEYCSIHPDFGFDYSDGLIRKLWHDRHIAEQAVTVEAIHRHGTLAAIELAHGGLASFNHLTKGPVHVRSPVRGRAPATRTPY